MFSRAFSKIGLLLAVLAAVLMTACGGGSGNPGNPTPLHMVVSAPTSYGPIKLEIFGGSPPFHILPDSTLVVLPETTNSRVVYGFLYPCTEDGDRTITVWDKQLGSPYYGKKVTFPTKGIPYEPSSLTVTPGLGGNCTAGTSGDHAQICAGAQGVATMQLNAGDPRNANQGVVFGVVFGDFEIRNASTGTWGNSAPTVTDSNGKAEVAIRARPNAQTQTAKIRAQVTGGEFLETSFIIIGATFRMLPDSASWTSTGTTCPSRTASFSLFGGMPPYALQTTLGSLSASNVTASGDSVTLTVAECGEGKLMARDAAGSEASATIRYTATPAQEPEPEPPPAPAIVITPVGNWGTATARVSCGTGTAPFNFTVAGGVPPYVGTYVSPMGLTDQEINGPVGRVTFTAAPFPPGTNVTIYVTDSDGKMGMRAIYCQ